MNKIKFGKYVNTHGLKGEICIISNFKYKDRVLLPGKVIIIDDQNYEILTYRHHKNYEMVTLKGIDFIDKIPFIKNTMVYIDKDLYLENFDYLDRDLMGFNISNSYFNDVVLDIYYITEKKKVVKTNQRIIPWELVDKVDLENKIIKVRDVEGL